MIRTTIAATGLILLGITLLYLFQDRFIYHPLGYKPGQLDLFMAHHPTTVKLNYRIDDEYQTAFYIPPKSVDGSLPARIWIVFSGNATTALAYDGWLDNFKDGNAAFLLVDYPGYGFNTGTPGERGIQRSANQAERRLAEFLNLDEAALERRAGIFGVSLGAAAAIDYATTHSRIQRLIVAAPFTNLRAMARRSVGWPLCNLLNGTYDNQSGLRLLSQRIPQPYVALFHGDADEVIPVAMSRTMAQQNPWVHYTEVPGASHGNVIYKAAGQIADAMSAGSLQ